MTEPLKTFQPGSGETSATIRVADDRGAFIDVTTRRLADSVRILVRDSYGGVIARLSIPIARGGV